MKSLKFPIIAIAASSLLFFSCSKNKESSSPMSDIVVKTGDVSEITETAAKISGMATLPTYETSFADYGVEISETEAMSSSRKIKFTGVRLTDAFSVEVKNMIPATKYYYRTYATLNGRDKYAEVKTFNTIPIVAAVSLNTPYCVSSKSFVVSGKAQIPTDYRLAAVTSLYYSDSTDPKAGSKVVLKLDENGEFCQTIDGLNPSTKYCCVASVTIADKFFDSEIHEVTTLKEISAIYDPNQGK